MPVTTEDMASPGSATIANFGYGQSEGVAPNIKPGTSRRDYIG